MAKIAFNKLNLKTNIDEIALHFNDQIIMVKQYLPIEDKLNLISQVIQDSHDIDRNYSNPVKTKVYTILEIIDYYTNINFTEKQRENTPELYDKIVSSGLWDLIMNIIPKEELQNIFNGIEISIEAYYKYRNSIFGILDAITTDYEDFNVNMDAIKEKINDPQVLNFVKDILNKVN